MPSVDVSIIIVSYNTRGLIDNCLTSISAHSAECRFEVIVVDNDSSDGTQAMIREKFPAVKLICNSSNEGFGRANNQGLIAAEGEYVLFLNSDTEALPGALTNLFLFAVEHPEAGIVAGKLYGDHEKNLQITCSTFPTPFILLVQNNFLRRTSVGKRVLDRHWLSGWDRCDTRIVEAVSGACMFIRKELFREVGGFDERFFMYFEDIDLSKTVSDRGHPNYYCHAAEFIHLSGKSPRDARALGKTYKESMRYYIMKHYGLHALVLFRVVREVLKPFSVFQKAFAAIGRKGHN